MSLQWTLAAGFLYAEIAVIFLFCLDFISAGRWKRIFNSKIVSLVHGYTSPSFYTLLVVLLLLLADSVNQMFKYRRIHEHQMEHPSGVGVSSANPSVQMFRAQRNFYISGFSLFLLLVLNRLVTILSRLAVAIAGQEAAVKQAQNASKQCERIMDENEELRRNSGSGSKTSSNAETDAEKLQQKLQEARKELEKANASMEAMKKQAESTGREYDRLLTEHAELQKQVDSGDKKDN